MQVYQKIPDASDKRWEPIRSGGNVLNLASRQHESNEAEPLTRLLLFESLCHLPKETSLPSY